jgi:transposase-like protein
MTTGTVLVGRERRRRWTTSEKLRLVEESFAPGASVAEVARRHEVHPNQLAGAKSLGREACRLRLARRRVLRRLRSQTRSRCRRQR